MKNEDAFMMMITRYILPANIKAGSHLLRWVLSKNIPSMFMHIPSSEQLLDSLLSVSRSWWAELSWAELWWAELSGQLAPCQGALLSRACPHWRKRLQQKWTVVWNNKTKRTKKMGPELNEFMWLCHRNEKVIHKNIVRNNSCEIMRRYV